MPSEYPAWSSGTNQTNIRKGSLSFSDMDTLFSVATTSESSTSPLPLSWDDSVWDFPLPNSNTTAALAPHQYVCEDSDDVNAIPAWESAPSDWDYESAHKVAEKLLSLDLSNENSAHDYKAYSSQQPNINPNTNPRFKTEFCRNFREKGACVYGENCQFAHGKTELRHDVVRHSKYKTKLCQKFWIAGYCAYGARCNFIHQQEDTDEVKHNNSTRGFRAFRSTFYRKTSESSDSGIDCVQRMPPPPARTMQDQKVKRPFLFEKGGWRSFRTYPEFNMNVHDSNQNLFSTFSKENNCFEEGKSIVPHPEHNPIPALSSRNGN